MDYVDRLEHARDCQIAQGYKAGNADREKKYTQMLGVNIWKKKVSQALNEQLPRLIRRSGTSGTEKRNLQITRSSTSSQAEKATKSSSNNDTPNTTARTLKRKRSSGELDLLDLPILSYIRLANERALETLDRTRKGEGIATPLHPFFPH